jgi:hypothetical protein
VALELIGTRAGHTKIEAHDDIAKDGAPRSMKMGTTRSLFPYDAAALHALQLVNLR